MSIIFFTGFRGYSQAHALLAFHASPFKSALIVSYDGGGNDGCFNAYVGSSEGVERIAQLDYNFGETLGLLKSLEKTTNICIFHIVR